MSDQSVQTSIQSIGILGAGAMGRGIAQIAILAGVDVILVDAAEGAAEKARDFVGSMVARAVEKGRLDNAAAEEAMARLSIGAEIAAFEDCDLVVEAIVEDLSIKQSVFQQLEAVVSADCILATNTSSLSVTSIAATASHPGRIAGYHFFNPVPLMKVVEVIAAARTDEVVVDRLVELADRMGHYPARVVDAPGFLINHAGRGYITEGLRVLSEQVASITQIDDIMRDAMGFPLGPFELLDLTGLDVSDPVMRSIYHQFYEEPRYRPHPETAKRLAAGLLGRKTGEGFYSYQDGKKQAVDEVAPVVSLPGSVWIWAERAIDRVELCRALEGAGVLIDEGQTPGSDALALLLLYGEDLSAAVSRMGLNPMQCLAVDPLPGFGKRVTVMASAASSQVACDWAHGLFGAAGVPVTLIDDSTGFVSQRVLGCVINTACEIAQQGIATPKDIDQAVRLGLGYPAGPLSWGDQLGPERILMILNRLLESTGDPRYRPSPWLRRRVQLGLSLTQESTLKAV